MGKSDIKICYVDYQSVLIKSYHNAMVGWTHPKFNRLSYTSRDLQPLLKLREALVKGECINLGVITRPEECHRARLKAGMSN